MFIICGFEESIWTLVYNASTNPNSFILDLLLHLCQHTLLYQVYIYISLSSICKVPTSVDCLHLKSFLSCANQDQVLHFLKDIFDLDKVRYSSVETLAEDMLHLLHRRSELLLAYLGADALRHTNTCNPQQVQLVPNALLEARVQWWTAPGSKTLLTWTPQYIV